LVRVLDFGTSTPHNISSPTDTLLDKVHELLRFIPVNLLISINAYRKSKKDAYKMIAALDKEETNRMNLFAVVDMFVVPLQSIAT
jgi:hypothetical protein